MDVRTFRAATLQEALQLVRRELGPEAAVLHTREVHGAGLFRWIPGMRKFEITASNDVVVPSRLPARPAEPDAAPAAPQNGTIMAPTAAWRPARDTSAAFGDEVRDQLSELQSLVEDLCRRSKSPQARELPESLFRLYTDLIEAEVLDDLARELVERVRSESGNKDLDDDVLLRARLVRMIEEDIPVGGPIQIEPGKRKLVALVGPTGVGKTTTIAKLAANFRLRDKRRVGLITVDTYRIAAVEQLRTYADIIDLPMRVVSTPREARAAVRELEDLDLVLMDTAGRSHKDDLKIQELKTILAEAAADEVHLVLSAGASTQTLQRTAEQFKTAGCTSLILTKLDEAASLGSILPLVRASQLPISYLTDGQNVPDDIAPANARRLAGAILGMEAAVSHA